MTVQRRRRTLTVAGQILLLQLRVVTVLVGGGVALAYVDARRDVEREATSRAVAVAVAVADAPTVPDALTDADPSAVLQPYAERVRVDSGTDFVVIMTPAGRRWTHPDPANIGKQFIGSISQAAAGQIHTEQYTGTLGPSVRAVVPVSDDGQVVALVAVGIRVSAVDRALVSSLSTLALAALAVLGVGAVGAWLISRRLRRQTHGMGEQEITRMYEYYDAVLHSVREGLFLLDHDGRVQLMNAEGRRLLGVGDADEVVLPVPLEALALPDTLAEVISAPEPVLDQIHLVGKRMLVVNQNPARWEGRELGSVVTLRDHTDLRAIAGELDTVRGLADSLRATNHESANRLHTVVSLVELGRTEEAIEFATAELALAQRLTDQVVASVEEPVVAALLLGKTAQAAERGIDLQIGEDSYVRDMTIEARDVVTVLGNLIDNAMDAVRSSEIGSSSGSADGETERTRAVRVDVSIDGPRLHATVDDSGPGLSDEQRAHAFQRGWSTKNHDGVLGRGIGLALVVAAVRRHGGTIDVQRSDLGGARFEVRIDGLSSPVNNGPA